MVTNISVVPNPVQGELMLMSEGDLSGSKVQIINSLGVVVFETSNTTQSIDVSSLVTGMYTLVFTKEDTRIIRQFVK